MRPFNFLPFLNPYLKTYPSKNIVTVLHEYKVDMLKTVNKNYTDNNFYIKAFSVKA